MGFRKQLAGAMVLVLLGGWFVLSYPFETTKRLSVPAKIYQDGVVVGETLVHIEGRRSNYLLRDGQYYEGVFHIEALERTGREGMRAQIIWVEARETQRILYHQNATFPEMPLHGTLRIHRNLEDFALGLSDGRILATSQEMLEAYQRSREGG